MKLPRFTFRGYKTPFFDLKMDKETITETLGNMSAGAATATGLIGFVESHTSLFSMLISSCGVIAAIIFYWLNYRMRKKEFNLKLKKLEKENNSSQST